MHFTWRGRATNDPIGLRSSRTGDRARDPASLSHASTPLDISCCEQVPVPPEAKLRCRRRSHESGGLRQDQQDRDGRSLGIARQEADARELAGRHGWDVVEVFSDNDTSATAYRPAFERLLKTSRAAGSTPSSPTRRDHRDVDADKARLFKACQADGYRIEIGTVASGRIDHPLHRRRPDAREHPRERRPGGAERTSERRRRQIKDKRARGEWASLNANQRNRIVKTTTATHHINNTRLTARPTAVFHSKQRPGPRPSRRRRRPYQYSIGRSDRHL